jgi:hypothetical protein
LLTFAVVMVRLIGLWLIASTLPFLVLVIADTVEQRGAWEQKDVIDIVRQAAVVGPILAGLGLLFWSRSIGRWIIRGVAENSPAPEAVTIRGFTQVGVFLLGLYALLNGVPSLIGTAVGGYGAQAQHVIYVALGLVLVLACVRLGKLVDALRRRH